MTQWATFAGLVGVVLVSLLALSQLTERSLTPAGGAGSSDGTESHVGTGSDGGTRTDGVARTGRETTDDRPDRPGSESAGDAERRPADANSADPDSADPDSARTDSTDGTGEPGRIPPFAEAPVDRAAERSRDGPKAAGSAPGRVRRGDAAAAYVDGQPVSTAALLGNVAVTQGLFAAVVVGAAIYTGIPADALGIELTASALRTGFGLGLALGLALYVANEGGAAIARRAGIDHDEALREMLAPDSIRGWAAMLVVVLPLIAAFEELLFRAAIVGALSIGFDLSPWLLAVVSSVAFAVGHGVQGTAGVAVTGLLGLVLAAAFVLTWNLWLVIVAHYLINALEFVVHEGVGIDWAGAAAGDAEP